MRSNKSVTYPVRIQSVQDLGILIRYARLRRKWTQAELASRVGVQPLWISQFERGKTTAQVDLVLRTLKALDLALLVEDPSHTSGKSSDVDLDALLGPVSHSGNQTFEERDNHE